MTPFGQEIKSGELSGEAAGVRQPDGVDEQISTLLESLEVESETVLPLPASRPPNSKPEPTSPGPVSREQPSKSRLDRLPPVPARAHRPAPVKGRGLDQPRAHRRRRRRSVGDLPAREDVLLLIVAVLIGIGVGLGIPLLLGS
jgi:hypothetical protein